MCDNNTRTLKKTQKETNKQQSRRYFMRCATVAIAVKEEKIKICNHYGNIMSKQERVPLGVGNRHKEWKIYILEKIAIEE